MTSSENHLLPGLGPHERCGQGHSSHANGVLGAFSPRVGGARHTQLAKTGQYLHLRCLLDVRLHPEGPPEPPSCAGAPGRDPSLRWLHLPAPRSNQPGAGRAARGSRESASGRGRGRNYTPVFDPVFQGELGGRGRQCPGAQRGAAPLLVLLPSLSLSQQSNRGSPSNGVPKQEDTGFP